MSDSSNPDTPQPPLDVSPAEPRPLTWLPGAIVAIVFISFMAAHLPDRVKLLGLFPLIWGAAAGWGLRWWADECQLKSSWWLWMTACGLLAAGEAGIVLEAWRLHRTELQSQFGKDPIAGFLKEAQQTPNTEISADEAALRKQLQAEVERVRNVRRNALSLPAFLQRRLKKVALLPQPWPELFWAGEIICGTLIGTWLVKRQIELPQPSVPPPTSEV